MKKRKAAIALGPAMRILARRLLAWDRARVDLRESQGHDVAAYRASQDLAETFIDADVDSWPIGVREFFMVLLEVTRTPTSPAAGIGQTRPVVDRLTRAERVAYRAIARDLAVLERLREASPRQWADDDGEGD